MSSKSTLKPTIHDPNNTLSFSFLGEHWRILRANMDSLWEEMVEANGNINTDSHSKNKKDCSHVNYDERLPYWAELWPSSLGLASWLHAKNIQIANQNCLDLGCGLGFTALYGAWCGAKVLGVDYEERAIMLAKENALANADKLFQTSTQIKTDTYSGTKAQTKAQTKTAASIHTTVQNNTQTKEHKIPHKSLEFKVMDWRTPFVPEKSFDFIWGADIIYERSFAQPVLNFLDYALTPDGTVWIAEPNRTIFEDFKRIFQNADLGIVGGDNLPQTPISPYAKKFTFTKVHSSQTQSLSAHIPSANVSIWELKRKSLL